MEPTLIKNNRIFNNQKKIIVTLIVFLVCLFIGTSYSILTSEDETEEVITFQAGELNLEVKTNTDTSVNLKDELPKSKEEVETPIILNIKNSGSLTICEYRLKLVADTDVESNLPTNYIRYAISEDNGVSYRDSRLLSETNNQIYIGFKLKPNETKTIYLKVWLDEETLDNEEILNKSFYGKIEAELLQRCETVATETLKETLGQDGGIIGVTNDNQKVTTDTENIREYRYSGLGVNNYVTFNDETWRILGVFKDENGQEHLKIVRNEILKRDLFPVTYEANGETFNIQYTDNDKSNYAYFDKVSSGKSYNNWDEAGLKYWLNSEGTTNGYIKILTNEAQDMTEDAKWYLGTVTYYTDTVLDDEDGDTSGAIDTPVEAYKMERAITGCSENKGPSGNSNKSAVEGNSTCRVWANNAATWTGKIGLMYPSDYGFSADSGYWDTDMRLQYFNKGPQNTSWLQKEANFFWRRVVIVSILSW